MIRENVILIVQWVIIIMMCFSLLSLTKNNKQINRSVKFVELVDAYSTIQTNDIKNKNHRVTIKYECNGEVIYIDKNLPEPTDSVYKIKSQMIKYELSNNLQAYNLDKD